MLSNVRLEVDDGITLVYGWPQNGTMFDLSGLTNVTVTHGRASGATSGVDRRPFQIDQATGAQRGSSSAFVGGFAGADPSMFHSRQRTAVARRAEGHRPIVTGRIRTGGGRRPHRCATS
jgi:hypothetical protein